ncbi:MAG: exo-beta-N-acetylmuramidase NamZ domain-containing protein [Gemmatimonadaceae bacterium]
MRLLSLVLPFALACTPPAAMPAVQTSSAGVIPGVEVLVTDSLHLVRGKRVGLLTNHSGRDRAGRSTIDILFRAPGVSLTALYGPEHGIRGDARAGEKISSTVDSATGVKIYSLYGDVQVPTADMLKDIDVLVYDIQDVGARVYTYEWTLALTANTAKKPIIILDRPDPIRADRIEGNILDPKFASLVGQYPVALRYGLTPGELLRYLAGAKLIDAEIHVVPMKNYRRSMWYDETGLPWITPSPNLRNLDAELLYPGTVFFEGTTATEGRGTDDPFTLIGASWMTDNAALAVELNALSLPGVRFDTATRTIEPGYKFAGQTIPMLKLRVTDRNAVRPVELGIRMLRAIYARHPNDFKWRERQIDRLAGTDRLRTAVEQNTVDALIAEWNADAVRFGAMVAPYRIYQ